MGEADALADADALLDDELPPSSSHAVPSPSASSPYGSPGRSCAWASALVEKSEQS
jgi:hypothetical protein